MWRVGYFLRVALVGSGRAMQGELGNRGVAPIALLSGGRKAQEVPGWALASRTVGGAARLPGAGSGILAHGALLGTKRLSEKLRQQVPSPSGRGLG